MNDKDLSRKLREEVPEAGPHYWARVDAALKNIEVVEGFDEEVDAVPVESAETSVFAQVDYQTSQVGEPTMVQSELSSVGGANAVAPQTVKVKRGYSKYLVSVAGVMLFVVGGFAVFQALDLNSSQDGVALTAESDSSSADEGNLGQEVERQSSEEASLDLKADPVSALESAEESSSDDLTEEDAAGNTSPGTPSGSTVVTVAPLDPSDFVWFQSLSRDGNPAGLQDFRFDDGEVEGFVVGTLASESSEVFSFSALAGQVLSVESMSPGSQVEFVVYDDEENQILSSVSGSSTTLSESELYFLVVSSQAADETDFELIVTIE